MKCKNRIINLVASGGLVLLYTVTYLLSLLTAHPIERLDYIATAGVVVGVAVLLNRIPVFHYIAILVFGIAAQYFGMMFSFYHTVWWYDLAVHFSSGILLGSIGRLFFSFLFRREESKPPLLAVIAFSVFFGIACAGLWEIYEYVADTFFGLTSQQGMGQTALHDTMQDIIAGSVGTLLYSGVLAAGKRLSSALSGEGR